ncbi:hypothetical protein ADUPG1_003888, partial [Aduncisulcus paluster]
RCRKEGGDTHGYECGRKDDLHRDCLSSICTLCSSTLPLSSIPVGGDDDHSCDSKCDSKCDSSPCTSSLHTRLNTTLHHKLSTPTISTPTIPTPTISTPTISTLHSQHTSTMTSLHSSLS